MKKLILGFIALLLVSGNAFAYSDDGNINEKREMSGAPAFAAYREYQLVRYPNNLDLATNLPLSQGDVVVWDCVSDDGVTVNLSSAASSVDAVAGVVVSLTIPSADVIGTTAQTDFGRRNWGYIQVRGLCTNVNIVGAGADSAPTLGGQALVAGTARNATAFPGALVTGANIRPVRTLGFVMDASTDGEVMIDL